MMRFTPLLLALPLVLPSCMPEVNKPQSSLGGPSEDHLATQSERITRLETELHEIRLLFTTQIKRIEEIAAQGNGAAQQRYLQQPQTPPQQVVIMPPNPVVTHRWDQQGRSQPQQYPAAPRSNASSGTHTIQPGDTLSEIAVANGISLSSLLTANPGTDPLRLRLGKKIIIPNGSYASAGSARATQQTKSYTVRPGDTLSEIAESHGVALSALLARNPGLDPTRLRVGKTVQVPGAVRQPQPAYQQQRALPDYQPNHSAPPAPATRYSSPQINSLQTQSAVPATQTNKLPTKKVLVRFPYEKTFGEIAREVGVDLATLQYLNNCTQGANSRVPANSTIFIPDPSE